MPRDPQTLVYVGIKKFVVALDARSGSELWRTELHGGDFVTVLWDGELLLAANDGEISCLDPVSGALIWRNELKGLGRGLVSLASSRVPGASAAPDLAAAKAKRTRDAAAHAAAG